MNQNTFNQQLEQAENLFAQGDMNNALEKFYQLNEQFPNSPEILNNIGVVQYNLNNLDQAETFISQALEIDPDFADAQNNLSAVKVSKHSNAGQTSNHYINDDNSPNQTEETFSINTRDNIQVCTPASIKYMTPFVLLEQEDWFEQEIDFIREFIQPGMNTLDIGACFGVYALLLAKLTGPSGKVYAFEPGSFARKHLEKSRQDNKFDNLEIFAQGLADKPGKTGLNLNSTPELNTIHEEKKEQVEDVELTTLDSWWQEAGQPEIDLIKLDVNNKESLVLQGAKEFLSQSSPAILFSLAKTGTSNNNLLQSLRELGFSLYQYIPGPGILAEFDQEAQPEPYLLNLIAVKPDKANKLQEQGLIAPSQIDVPDPESDAWNDYLSKLPWTGTLLPGWQKQSEEQKHQDYLQALNFICSAQDPKNTKPQQLGQTQLATQKLMQLYNDEANGPVAFTLARGLRDLGLRQQAVQILERLLQEIQTGKDVNFDLPFLPPLPGFDHVPIEQSAQKWIMARCMESLIYLRSYSCYFSAQQDMEHMQALDKNPESTLESQRRLALISLQQNLENTIKDNSSLLKERQQCLNVWFWKNLAFNKSEKLMTQTYEQQRINNSNDNFSETIKKSHWDNIQKARTQNDTERYCTELEKYLNNFPEDLQALSMLTNYYWSIWLPETYQINLLIKLVDIALRTHKKNKTMEETLKKANVLYQRKRGVDIGRKILAQYENIHKGERCVIIGNGPSLNKMDLSFLKNEYTFGMNRIYLGFDKFDFHPTYHICVNPTMLEQSGHEMLEKVNCPKFFNFEAIPTLSPDDDVIFLNCRKTLAHFNTDPRHGVTLGSTVTYGAMQLAYFMGFTEIVLIGVDHNFETKGQPHKLIESQGDDPNHFHPDYFGKGYKWQLPDLEDSERSYKIAKKYYEDVDRRIVDATVDGKCPVFEKIDYRNYFGLKNYTFYHRTRKENSSFEHGHALLMEHIRENVDINNHINRKLNLIEIGSTRENLPGQESTLKLAKFCNKYGIHFITVDMDPYNTDNAQKQLEKINKKYEAINAKGENFLKNYQNNIDFLFLDGYDFDHGKHSLYRQSRYKKNLGKKINNHECHKMHLECAKNIIDKITNNGIISLDDTWIENGIWKGKGATAVPYLLENGFSILTIGYNSVLLQKRQHISFPNINIKNIICSHHKSGTNFILKVFNEIIKYFNLKRWMKFYNPQEPSEWDICIHQHANIQDLINYYDFAGLHFVRNPKSLIYSATLYHEQCNEAWVDIPLQQFTSHTFYACTSGFYPNSVKKLH